MSDRRFVFEVVSRTVLAAADIFDPDIPENPTVEDVRAVIEACGGDACVIRDWGLLEYGEEGGIAVTMIEDEED